MAEREIDPEVAAIASWLARTDDQADAEVPAALASIMMTPQPELAILRSLCRGRRVRAQAAAEVLARVARSMAERSHEPAEAPPPDASATASEAPVSHFPIASWKDGLRDAEGEVERVLALEDDIQRLSPWLGIGWHRDGSTLVEVVHDRLDDLTRLLDRRPELARIAAMLGRLEAAERRGRGAERGGRETVVGVRFGGELSDVLPNELALLGDEATEDIFYARLTERQLLSLELSGELEGQVRTERRPGPVIACIDTSGSLIGPAEEVGKAATLAVLRRVLRDGRRARVLLFGGRDSLKEIDLRPGHADARALFDFLLTSFHGGTDVDQPLARALVIRERDPGFGKADLLLVTDGVARLRGVTTAAIRAARKAGMRLVLALVGDRPSLLGDIADETTRVALDPALESA